MSLQASNMFDKYYKLFQGNDQRCQRYQVVLSSFQVYSGIPMVAAGTDQTGSFLVTLDSGKQTEVKWNRLLAACPI